MVVPTRIGGIAWVSNENSCLRVSFHVFQRQLLMQSLLIRVSEAKLLEQLLVVLLALLFSLDWWLLRFFIYGVSRHDRKRTKLEYMQELLALQLMSSRY